MEIVRGFALAAALAGVLLMTLGAPQVALADKAHDTLNLAEILPLGGVDSYYGTFPHTEFMTNMLFDTLVDYDPAKKSVVPLLAKSWKQAPASIDFELRDDVKWHDGTKLTADDVVYTLGWLIDPNSRYPRKFKWSFIKGVKKTGPLSVHVDTDGERPFDLLMLTLAPIYPQHVRAGLADPTDFGRKPVGSGPYKLVDYSESAGRLTVVKNPDYKWGGATKRPTNIGKVVMRSIPDQGAQTSALMVGDVDVFRGLPADQAEALTKDPRFVLDVNPGIGFTYMWFDATGKAGNPALANPKVRQALAMAVNRAHLDRMMNGDVKMPSPQNMCWRDKIIGCDFTKGVPGYDPARAKKLLAEAGYPDGFSVRITSYVGRFTQLAEAVAGDLAAVGVKATIEPVTVTTYNKKLDAGQIQITVAGNSLTGVPDITQLYGFFFLAHDYTGDPGLLKIGAAFDAEMDVQKRRKLARTFFDRVSEMNYISPLTAQPQMFVHSKDLQMRTDAINSYGMTISDLRWK
jgi:peptide/nickel transport system substrate-binding protein